MSVELRGRELPLIVLATVTSAFAAMLALLP
jgi:hypothetical protein